MTARAKFPAPTAHPSESMYDKRLGFKTEPIDSSDAYRLIISIQDLVPACVPVSCTLCMRARWRRFRTRNKTIKRKKLEYPNRPEDWHRTPPFGELGDYKM